MTEYQALCCTGTFMAQNCQWAAAGGSWCRRLTAGACQQPQPQEQPADLLMRTGDQPPAAEAWQQHMHSLLQYEHPQQAMQQRPCSAVCARSLALAEAAAHAGGAAAAPQRSTAWAGARRRLLPQRTAGGAAGGGARGRGSRRVVFSGNHVMPPGAPAPPQTQEQERIRRRVRSGDPLLVPHRIIPCTCPAAAFLAGKCATLGSPCSVN